LSDAAVSLQNGWFWQETPSRCGSHLNLPVFSNQAGNAIAVRLSSESAGFSNQAGTAVAVRLSSESAGFSN
jgi:hypothetical protein